MKNKNPLYVVKGQDVLEARSFIDLIIKKFNLAPFIHLLQQILMAFIRQVRNQSGLQNLQNFLEKVYSPILLMIQKLKFL